MVNKGIIGLGILVVMALVPFAASAVSPEAIQSARAQYRQGVYAFQSGDLATAESFMKDSIATYGLDPRPQYYLGLIRYRQGDLAEATRLVEQGAKIEMGHMPRMVDTNGSLEFVQGEERRFVEQYRLEARQKKAAAMAVWYEQRYIRGDWPGVIRRRVGDIEDAGNREKLTGILAQIEQVTTAANTGSVEAITKIAQLEKERESTRQNACDVWNNDAEQTSVAVLGANAWPGLDRALGVEPATTDAAQPASTVETAASAPSDEIDLGEDKADSDNAFGEDASAVEDNSDPFGDSTNDENLDPFAE